MERQFAELGIAAERIEAITPDDILPATLGRYCEPGPFSLQWVQPTELACTFSHRKAWTEVVSRGLERAAILEDDVALSRGFRSALSTAAEADADVVRLETRLAPMLIEPGNGLKRLFTFHSGTGAYVVSRRGAQKLLEVTSLQFPVDNIMFDPRGPMFDRLSIRQLVPAVAKPGEIGIDTSEIGDRRSRTNPMARRMNWPHGLLRRAFYRAREGIRQSIAMRQGARLVPVPFDGG